MEPTPDDKTLSSSEAKFIIRNGQPIAVYKKNSVLRLYTLKETSYEEISDIIEPSVPQRVIKNQE